VNTRAFFFLLLDAGQLERFIKFENKHKNCWFNSMMQMLLATGHVVDTVRRLGSVDQDRASIRVLAICDLLFHTLKRYDNHAKTKDDIIVNQNFIEEILGGLAFGGVKVFPGRRACALEFFDSTVTPVLRFYGLQFETAMDAQIECASCKEDMPEMLSR
jgi:hypothetical protein